ncbi:hypothetical protein SAMN05216497_13113 [Clostridium cochlearium]|uniref:Uncharacterized protein n=1 Tax=Clostridium cochlearium TaxID=1494 RepID=A0ABY0QP25_CLOCO|nr:hypothetical protein [Clostridium cochlearium]SDL41837.1 hypothetical protein SAMN05216497_13113 [Clostridium cochlearium]
MRVKLKFESPFIVGGKNIERNYIESLDYIQGNVVRAAFAKIILNNCNEYKRDETVMVNGKRKKNWVYYRNKEKCKTCKFRNLCKNFSDIKFSYFYPEGTEIIPLTLMKCKKDDNHNFVDCLIEQRQCKDCKTGDKRVEFTTGFIKDGELYKVKKDFLIRTAIDKYTKTSKDENLYSILVVSETSKNKNVFQGNIQGIDEKDLKIIDELRIGKYISVGLGKCKLFIEKEPKVDKSKIIKNMNRFNEKYKSFNKENCDMNYFALKFTSDARLDVELRDISYKTNEEYKDMWHKALNIEEEFKIEKVYSEINNYRGYDMSRADKGIREDAVLMAEKGTVIVLKTDKSFKEIYNDFSQLQGLGEENENGFGDFKFYFGGIDNE